MAFIDSVRETHKRMADILVQKRDMRGTKNIQEQGISGVLARMGKDKLARLEKEVELRKVRDACAEAGMPVDVYEKYFPLNETDGDSFVDDLLDVANYALIAIALYEGWWEE